jgi:Ca2+-transporting ATPase
MLALLIGGGFVYLALGDVKEAIIRLVFACLSAVITVVAYMKLSSVLSDRKPALSEPGSRNGFAI